jgi:hypothetical protein
LVFSTGERAMSTLDAVLNNKVNPTEVPDDTAKSAFLGNLLNHLVKGVKAANSMPSAEDYK